VVVFTNRDAAATACSASVDFTGDLFSEDRELPRSATANELVFYPFGVMPRVLAGAMY
jgi:hypothetical protein